ARPPGCCRSEGPGGQRLRRRLRRWCSMSGAWPSAAERRQREHRLPRWRLLLEAARSRTTRSSSSSPGPSVASVAPVAMDREDRLLLYNALAQLQGSLIRVAAQPPQFNEFLVSCSVRYTAVRRS